MDDALFFAVANLYVKRHVERDSDGKPLRLTHHQAMDYAAQAGDGWRLPTVDEVTGLFGESVLEDTRYWSWTSSPVAGGEDRAWVVNFDLGLVYHYRSNTGYVRLVRPLG